MTTGYRLYYAPDNASLCVRLALEEMELPYETVLVDRTAQAQRSSNYLSLNPNGLIPVLETADGVIFETGAILLWLADKHGKLAPAHDAPTRGDFLKWMFWISNALQLTLRMTCYPEKFCQAAPDELRNQNIERLKDLLDIAESQMELTQVSVLQCYMAPILRWLALHPVGHTEWFQLNDWPRLKTFCEIMDVRPSAIRAAQAEGLGNTPFSNPQYPNPPEGVAI
ncbi:hypothetical protein BVC71_11475 [Marivivens niveibacter]|uniref:GST N-terminal domain-containing protein n=1 Tax=Marivivens niveibacter TaxID=1930667 RepID=A0A251WYV2_9RHOB|nr:glutathione S-transferase family protein [Marivivens niveibacter]OUD09308.1 hypothetical protein BVC71_11475 [Marivivens niveibacter]